MRALAATGEAFGDRDAAEHGAGIRIDPLAVILNEPDAAGDGEHTAVGDREEVRGLRELLEELRVGAEDRERVLDRGIGEEAAVRIDDVVAAVPEERRRDAGDLDVGQSAADAGEDGLVGALAELAFLAVGDLVLVADRPPCLVVRYTRGLDERAA